MFSGMDTSQGSGHILVRMSGSREKIMVRSAQALGAFWSKWNSAFCLFMPSPPLTRPADLFKCSNACRPVQWDVQLAKDQVIYLCACVEVERLSWYICALIDAFSNKWNSALCLFMSFSPPTRAADIFKVFYCMQTCSVGSTLPNDPMWYTSDACVLVGRIPQYRSACTLDAFSKKWNSALCVWEAFEDSKKACMHMFHLFWKCMSTCAAGM